jgi:hypothetical protein
MHDEMATAIVREKQLKKWNRGWKIELIEKMNPGWLDLYENPQPLRILHRFIGSPLARPLARE